MVFVTNGSMTSDSTLGSMDSAPILKTTRSGGSWVLWETLSRKYADFGNPSVFNGAIGLSKWESFTVTAKDSRFFDLLEKFSGNVAGRGGLVTLKDSHWLLTVVLNHQPHFHEQPKDAWVWWGYGLFPDKVGNFVHKKMSDCTGREILTEVMSHFHFMDDIPHVLETSNCIPCMMPYITSQFMPREKGDRPLVVPKGSTNLAFIGQFCEVPEDVVFTVEYSVRSAQMAVYKLLEFEREPAPFYKGYHDVSVMFDALRTLNRSPKKPEAPEKRV